MAAIPAGGSLVATHDYYRSKNLSTKHWYTCKLSHTSPTWTIWGHAVHGSICLFSGRLGSTSSSSSCGSSEYTGEVIPHHPGVYFTISPSFEPWPHHRYLEESRSEKYADSFEIIRDCDVSNHWFGCLAGNDSYDMIQLGMIRFQVLHGSL